MFEIGIPYIAPKKLILEGVGFKSEVKGKITDIQADNSEPVEFGQVLFVIEPIK